MCYVTLRGLVYFGASIHVYHGIQLMLNMCYNLFSDGRDYYVSRVDIIFNWCFLVLGIFIFRGVEQQSKTFIRWPTVGFTLLLALRFIVELLKQYQYEREAIYQTLKTLGPFTYTNMSIDVDPLISAAVGIYIFILFVYNHSLEYSDHSPRNSGEGDSLPFHHSSSARRGGGNSQGCGGCHRRNNSCDEDTARLIPTIPRGDSNNNSEGDNNRIIPPISTHPNPLYEYDQAIRMMDARRPNLNCQQNHQGLAQMQYKVEAV